jgi:hypothetical protein
MPILETSIDTESDEYKANYGAMERLVADLQAELSKARDERSQKSRDRLAQTGKLPVQKKLELLLDRNTPFLEIGALAAKDMYDGKIHQAGVRPVSASSRAASVSSASTTPRSRAAPSTPWGSRNPCACRPSPWKTACPSSA